MEKLFDKVEICKEGTDYEVFQTLEKKQKTTSDKIRTIVNLAHSLFARWA